MHRSRGSAPPPAARTAPGPLRTTARPGWCLSDRCRGEPDRLSVELPARAGGPTSHRPTSNRFLSGRRPPARTAPRGPDTAAPEYLIPQTDLYRLADRYVRSAPSG